MINVCCGLSVGIYTPGHLHRSSIVPGFTQICCGLSASTWFTPGSHPDMLWLAIRGHTQFACDIIQGHTQIMISCGLSVCTWFTLGSTRYAMNQICHVDQPDMPCGSHPVCTWYTVIQGRTQICCGLSASTWFTPGSHPDMLWLVSLHMIYFGVTPKYAVDCQIKTGYLTFQLLQTVSYIVSRECTTTHPPPLHKRNRHPGVLCMILSLDEFLFKIYCYYMSQYLWIFPNLC